jgi:hypothetical protein
MAEEVEVNKNGNNVKIKCHLLPEAEMRKFGFTDYAGDTWCYSKPVYKKSYEISFDISINKLDADNYRIDVLDEDFCQPYDYQHMLENNPTAEIPLKISEDVEREMARLADAGIVSGHVYGEYI